MMQELLKGCLYFTANQLAREAGKLAEEEFRKIGLSPTYAFLILVVKEQPRITLTELSSILHIAPSTGTRFVDKLIVKGLVDRKTEGKLAKVTLTEKGLQLHDEIQACWDRLYDRYSAIFGKEEGDALTETVLKASETLRKAE
ncbi:MarR family transcriptional regulator [Shimazuella sp. AN120528]|uniref:MarR family winged helix-turn-helix transcriptional regulator n=1 Tax=Shimazuella soli TaxID=1892854 RepID=UPI001F104672|nr:MarR family transcriptional regulator [Shimazuella soli]MCH5586113.1 MarR family transcriptional regulator [Shimazuella soli]